MNRAIDRVAQENRIINVMIQQLQAMKVANKELVRALCLGHASLREASSNGWGTTD